MDPPEATNGALDGDSTDGTDGSGLLPSDGGGGELPDGGAGCVGETEHGEDGDEMECMEVKEKCRKEDVRSEVRLPFALIVVPRCLVATKTRFVTIIHLMDGQAPSPLMHTPVQRPYPYHPNAPFPYTQQQPYPSPLSTNPTRPLHTPHPYNPQQRPIHPLPNGHSPKFPMTPPYPPYLNGPIQTPPPSSSGSEALPSNHIHIMQTTPQAVMLRSNSTLSTTSTNRPPPLSNGPSPAVEEVIVDMSDQYDMYPAQQAQMRQVVVGPRMGMDQVQARAVVNAARPNEMDGLPRQMVVSQQIPIPNTSPSTGVIPASDSGMGNLWQR